MNKTLEFVADNPEKGYAFNVYTDEDDNIYIEHVWNNAGTIKITPNKEITHE